MQVLWLVKNHTKIHRKFQAKATMKNMIFWFRYQIMTIHIIKKVFIPKKHLNQQVNCWTNRIFSWRFYSLEEHKFEPQIYLYPTILRNRNMTNNNASREHTCSKNDFISPKCSDFIWRHNSVNGILTISGTCQKQIWVKNIIDSIERTIG